MDNQAVQKTIDKSPIYTLAQSVIGFFEQSYFNSYLEGYKLYLGYKGDRSATLEPWQTNITYPIIPTIIDTLHSTMFDNQSVFTVGAYSKADKERTDKPRMYLNWTFDVSDSRDELFDILKEALITGNGFGKITLIEEKDEVMVRDTKGGKKSKIFKKQYCGIEYKSCFEIFYDPSVKRFQDSRYVLERGIINSEKVIKNYSLLVKSALNLETTELAEEYLRSIIRHGKDNPVRFSEMDCNIIRDINLIPVGTRSTSLVQTQVGGLAAQSAGSVERYNNIYKIEFDKKAEGVHEIVEYWEDNKFILNIDGYEVCATNKNPLDRKFKPYFHIPVNKVPGRVNGQGIAVSNADFQSIANTLYNIFLDNLKMSIAPMFEKVGGIDSMLQKQKKLKYDPYGIIHTNTPGSLKKLDLGLNDFSPINALSSLEGLVEKKVGINEYVMGNQGKVERTAAGVEQLASAFQRRMLPVYAAMNKAMGFVAKSWIFLAITHFDNEFEIYSEEAGKQRNFLKVTLEELLGDFTFFWDARSAVSASKILQRDKLEKLLPLIKMAVDPATQRPLLKGEPLWRAYLDSLSLELGADVVMDMEDYIASQIAIGKSQEEIQKELRTASTNNFPQPGGRPGGQYSPGGELKPNMGQPTGQTNAQIIESQPGQTIDEPASTEFTPSEEPFNQDSILKYINK